MTKTTITVKHTYLNKDTIDNYINNRTSSPPFDSKKNGSQRQPGTKDKVTNAIYTDERKRKSFAMKEGQKKDSNAWFTIMIQT